MPVEAGEEGWFPREVKTGERTFQWAKTEEVPSLGHSRRPE